jgi:hypothetical protein
MRRGHGHFVDPHLGRLVWVNVMHRRREADHDAGVVDRDREMMPCVREKFGRPRRVDAAVEDVGGDVGEDAGIGRAEDPDLDRHGRHLIRAPGSSRVT